MAHAVSLSYARFDHMSATAVAMTTLLHAAVAAALWWISPLHQVDPYEDPIEVTMEQEKPVQIPPSEIPTPPPPPEPLAQPASPPPSPAPAPPVRYGLAPASPDSDVHATTPGAEKPSPSKPETPAQEATQPDPPKDEPPIKEQQQALAVPPPPPPPPPPSLEQALPPLEAPPPPLTSREIPRPPPAVQAPPPPSPPQPAQRVQPTPRPAPMPQQLQSSPLSHVPQPKAPGEQQASRQAPTFQNPADMYGQKRAESDYLWQIARKVSAHQQFVGNATTEAGTVELRLTIARDGQLVGVAISRSSGLPSLDSTSMNIVRAAGPYGPLPAEITGAQHSFTLPLYYRRN